MKIFAVLSVCLLSFMGQSAHAAQYSCVASPHPAKPNNTSPQTATGSGPSIDVAKQAALTSCQISFGVNANCQVDNCNGAL